MISKRILIPTLAVTVIGGAVVLGAAQIHAQGTAQPFSGLVAAIAQKFGLDQGQVQSVVDQYRTQQKQTMTQTRQKRQDDRLEQFVTSGKITEVQKQAIETELASIKTKYNPANNKSMTKDQIQQQFQTMRDELTSWAKSQGIDPSYVMPGFGMNGRWKGRMWMKPSPTPTP